MVEYHTYLRYALVGEKECSLLEVKQVWSNCTVRTVLVGGPVP